MAAVDGISLWDLHGRFLQKLVVKIGTKDGTNHLVRNSRAEPVQNSCIAVFTKDSLARLKISLPHLVGKPLPVFLIDDSVGDDTLRWIASSFEGTNIIYHGRKEQDRFVCRVKSSGLLRFVPRLGRAQWQLGRCRNYALLLARASGFSRILLLDDDIVVFSFNRLRNSLDLLSRFGLVGASTTGMPDDSVVGHIVRSGKKRNSEFVSGQCLAIDLARVRLPFPDIYNEDWIFALLHSLSVPVARYSSAYQLQYEPFHDIVDKSAFQEPGEVFCVGVIEAVRRRNLALLKEEEFWTTVCRWRTEFLKVLSQKRDSNRQKTEVASGMRALEKFHASRVPTKLCRFAVQYLSSFSAWEHLYQKLRAERWGSG
jgi:hypothetical protein